MSNFIEEFKRGQSNAIKGIPFGKGLEKITLDTKLTINIILNQVINLKLPYF